MLGKKRTPYENQVNFEQIRGEVLLRRIAPCEEADKRGLEKNWVQRAEVEERNLNELKKESKKTTQTVQRELSILLGRSDEKPTERGDGRKLIRRKTACLS